MTKEAFLIFDLETSGLFKPALPAHDKEQAWPVQFGALFTDKDLNPTREFSFLLQPPFEGCTIEQEAFETHHIPLERCIKDGVPIGSLYTLMKPVFYDGVRLVGHNLGFDTKFIRRLPKNNKEMAALEIAIKNGICTMRSTTTFCELPPTEAMLKRFKKASFKSPKLEELHMKLFGATFTDAHNAITDVRITHKCLVECVKRGIIKL